MKFKKQRGPPEERRAGVQIFPFDIFRDQMFPLATIIFSLKNPVKTAAR